MQKYVASYVHVANNKREFTNDFFNAKNDGEAWSVAKKRQIERGHPNVPISIADISNCFEKENDKSFGLGFFWGCVISVIIKVLFF